MGYNTDFTGTLKFKNELTIPQLKLLNSILGEDIRDHEGWQNWLNVNKTDIYYIDLALNRDMDGIEWSGSEKTYNMAGQVNIVISLMREKFPDFGLVGKLKAQGEDPNDRYNVVIGDNGFALKKKIKVVEVEDDE